jgi:hypothetical protein
MGPDPYFDSRLDKFAALATRFAMPTIHALREFITSGGLMSYGADLADATTAARYGADRLVNPAGVPAS